MIQKATNAAVVLHPGCGSMCGSKQHYGHVQAPASLPQQAKAFLTGLFDTSNWPPRWHCGTWSDFHGWLYILSDLMIWGAYFAIPFLLFLIIRKKKGIPFPKIIWLFIAFILLCGTTHLFDAVIFWWPAYRLSALVRFITGMVSITTVWALYKILPSVYRLRTLEELEAEIEERKKAEEETRHHQVLQRAAEELLERKDEFMSIASHELKTPLTSLKASLQIAERMTATDNALLKVAPFIKKSGRQVDKLTGIIHDLLDVTRIQAGKMELSKTHFNLFTLVEECAENCKPEGELRHAQIEGDPHLQVYADSCRIDQVLCNLLTNAFKYSRGEQPVTVRLQKQDGGKVKVSVTDKGIGISEDKIEHVFERFYRVERTSQNFSGLGLGLYISSEIVKQHGGEIGVTSIFGQGSTFWFTI